MSPADYLAAAQRSDRAAILARTVVESREHRRQATRLRMRALLGGRVESERHRNPTED